MKPFRLFGQFIQFSLVGVSNAIVSYAVYVALSYIGFHFCIRYKYIELVLLE